MDDFYAQCTNIGLFSPSFFYWLRLTLFRQLFLLTGIKITILNWSEKRAHCSLVHKALWLACSRWVKLFSLFEFKFVDSAESMTELLMSHSWFKTHYGNSISQSFQLWSILMQCYIQTFFRHIVFLKLRIG